MRVLVLAMRQTVCIFFPVFLSRPYFAMVGEILSRYFWFGSQWHFLPFSSHQFQGIIIMNVVGNPNVLNKFYQGIWSFRTGVHGVSTDKANIIYVYLSHIMLPGQFQKALCRIYHAYFLGNIWSSIHAIVLLSPIPDRRANSWGSIQDLLVIIIALESLRICYPRALWHILQVSADGINATPHL